jgi:N-ethylmaleimide reductase
VGRASHAEYQPEGAAPLAPSAIAITDPAWTVYTPKGEGPFPYPEPRALREDEIPGLVQVRQSGARAQASCAWC